MESARENPPSISAPAHNKRHNKGCARRRIHHCFAPTLPSFILCRRIKPNENIILLLSATFFHLLLCIYPIKRYVRRIQQIWDQVRISFISPSTSVDDAPSCRPNRAEFYFKLNRRQLSDIGKGLFSIFRAPAVKVSQHRIKSAHKYTVEHVSFPARADLVTHISVSMMNHILCVQLKKRVFIALGVSPPRLFFSVRSFFNRISLAVMQV